MDDKNFKGSLDDWHKERKQKTLRMIWTILIGVFAVILAIDFYRWSEGKEALRHLLTPVAFILLGTASLISLRQPKTAKFLIGLAILAIAAGLVLMIIY